MRLGRALAGFAAGLVGIAIVGGVAVPGIRDVAKKKNVDYRFVVMTDEWEDLCNELNDTFGFNVNYDAAGQDFLTWYFDAIEELAEIIENNGGIDPMLEAADWGQRILDAYGVQEGDLDIPPN